MSANLPVQFDLVAERKFARAQAARFIGRHAAALSAGYSIHVSTTGRIHVQGEAGSLQALAARWEGLRVEPSESGEWGEWVCELEGVTVVLTEEQP